VKQQIVDLVTTAIGQLRDQGVFPADVPMNFKVERPREKQHGDFATNAAIVLARHAAMPSRTLATRLIETMTPLMVTGSHCEIAGPGFINFRLAASQWQQLIGTIHSAGASYGRSNLGAGQPVQVEFVSANPTGPMHVGHGRGAVVGDVLSRLLDAVGYRVEREYYINDAGGQILILGQSVLLRYLEAHGQSVVWPEEGYPGAYVREIAEALKQRDGDRWCHGITRNADGHAEVQKDQVAREILDFAITWVMAVIRQDLSQLDIRFDVWFSERTLHASGAIGRALEILTRKGVVYQGVLEPPKGKEPPEDWEPRVQTLFRSRDFGDDVDRPLQKSDGSYTYFAADIAYHLHKAERGFVRLFDVWGADHGGYVKRVQAAMKALTGREGDPEVLLVQMVNLTRAGQPVRMSKRAGTFVTLREVVDEVGRDAVRFWFLTRSVGARLDFDLELAVSRSNDNLVFYVQYAYARICAVYRQAAARTLDPAPDGLDGLDAGAHADAALLTAEVELDLLRLLGSYPEMVEGAALVGEPHRLAYYAIDLAAAFHTFYNQCRILDADPAVRRARMALLGALRQVFLNVLGLMGVTAPEQM
jgi:arginyl-tRNA synthetase